MAGDRLLLRRSLIVRLAAWIAAIFVVTIAIFGIVVYFVVYVEERDEGAKAATESSSEVASDVEGEVLTALAIAAPFGLVLSVGGAAWISRRTLAPIAGVVRAATEITAQRLDLRLPVPPVDDELAALVTTLNALLTRLEKGFAAQVRFAAHASHELRTPLAVIAGQLEVALRRPRSDAEWVATAGDVLQEAQRLSRLVDALLRLRRAEVGPPAVPAESADLASIIDEVVARSGDAARAAQVVFEIADVPAAMVSAEPEELVAAVGNVVSNAVRVSPPGGRIRIGAELDGRSVTIHVDDEGPGIAPGDEERIFAPFVRGPSGQASDGFGLGLAIARSVVENVGGTLVAGKGARGARFTFTLPRAS